jgi:hypothetical protein
MKNLPIASATAAARADRDALAISNLLGIDTGSTFFPHGTELVDAGKKLARRTRADFLALPALEEGMEQLRAAVQAEERADHWVDLGGVFVDYLGRVVCERDERTPDAIIPRLVPSEGGWQRLAAFAPEDVPAGLRTNVNAWAGRRRGAEVRVRTRNAVAGDARELYAVVSPRYVPYDVDAIAADVAELLPADARVRVRYDRQRTRIDAVLANPHYFPDSTGTASVGEAHRLTLRIRTADDGTGGFSLTWAAERIRCVNLTLLRGKRTVFRARHTRDDLAEVVREALAAQGEVAEAFASTWRSAWTSYYSDQAGKLGGLEALRRIAYHGLVRIPGLGKVDTFAALRDAFEAEPGDSVAAVHNAITRAAHAAPVAPRSRWCDDEAEDQAGDLLAQHVAVRLAPIPGGDLAAAGGAW